MRPGTRFSQIGLGIHRAFRSPCARRGNRGRETVQSSEFSNHPDFHSRVLEKRAADQPILREGLSLLFHFSSLNYGDYYLSSYLLPIFLLSVACYTLASLTRYHDPVFRAVRCVPVRNAGRSEPANHLGPGIQTTFTISTQTIVSKVNTIERNPGGVFPPGLKLL